ncbi:MAG: (2Fe-2S)-binding protein [Marinobacter sp.]
MAGPEHQASDWLTGYHRLLESHGLNASDVLSSALPAEASRCSALFSLADVLEQPDILSQQILSDHPDTVTPRLKKARLSVLHQSLALTVIGPLVVKLFWDGKAPPADSERILLRPVQDTPEGESRWIHLPGSPEKSEKLEPEAFAGKAKEQMQAWYPVFRKHYGISPGAYWSSVGLAFGMPFSLLWNRVEPGALCQLAGTWLAQFECEANRYVEWIPAEFSQQLCAIPQRKGCCLKYLLPEGGYCGTCGVYRKERMKAVTCPESAR